MKLFVLTLIVFVFYFKRISPESFKAPFWQISPRNQYRIEFIFGGVLVGYFGFLSFITLLEGSTTGTVICLAIWTWLWVWWLKSLRKLRAAIPVTGVSSGTQSSRSHRGKTIGLVIGGIALLVVFLWKTGVHDSAHAQFQSIFGVPVPTSVASISYYHAGPLWLFGLRGDAACMATLENLSIAPRRADSEVGAGYGKDRVPSLVSQDSYWQHLTNIGKPIYEGLYPSKTGALFIEFFTDKETAGWIVVRGW